MNAIYSEAPQLFDAIDELFKSREDVDAQDIRPILTLFAD